MNELPVRYWKFDFRSPTGVYRGACAISQLKLFDEAGNHLTEGIEPEVTLVGTAKYGNSEAAVIDHDLSTGYGWYWNGSANANTRAEFVYDLGEPKNAQYSEVAITNAISAPPNMSYTSASDIVLWLYSSTDKLTWTLTYIQPRVFVSYNESYRIALHSNSELWPAPRRNLLGGSGGIYGIVSEDGIARPNRPVYLYERDTFSRIGYATTDENGGYAFNGLNTSREYLVMSVDPTGPPYRNAIVWDRIKPINTKGNIAPQSAFWAMRARDPDLGAVVAVTDYIDATAYDYMNGGQLGGAPFQYIGNNYPDMDFDSVDAVGGSLKFLKSNRNALTRGRGLFALTGSCIFSKKAEHNQPENYNALTFEYILKSPANGQEPLIATWTGRVDGRNQDFYYEGSSYQGFGSGPTIEVTDQIVNIRFPLSGRNRGTPKAAYPIVPDQVYHIAISYLQDETIDCYINGVLAGSTAIPAAGRLWGHSMARYDNGYPFNGWDSYEGGRFNAPISWLTALHIGGTGQGLNTSRSVLSRIPPGHGGSFAMAAVYGRNMSADEVADLYDSFVNWETHGVPTTQSGYAGEVEADTPALYYRMNDLSADDKPECIVGHKGVNSEWEGLPRFNAQGFVAGNPAVDTSTGSLLISESSVINSVFTIEFMMRQTDQAGTQYPFMARLYNSSAVVYLDLVDGLLTLKVTDPGGTMVPVANAQSLSANTDYHVVVTYDPWDDRKSKIYLNGELKGVAGTPSFPDVYSLAHWFCVGANASGTAPSIGNRFKGIIGEFALYGYVLPADRIAAHYAALNA